ncbi:MAG: ATP-dependent endonuclease [Candidatus Gastranaerophilales bacterium]|nr:ATP-dependent endonuclease [Candidatus Gastranaerophilales bacterium]
MRISRSDKISSLMEIPCSVHGLEATKIIIKPMEYNELLISLERLIRFEYPIKKKNRVYREILFKNLISPKISLKNYYDYSLSTINALVKIIWDSSLEKLGINQPGHYGINACIAYEELKTFSVYSMITDLITSENISKFSRILEPDNLAQNTDPTITCLNEAGFSITKNENLNNLSSVYFQYKLNFPLNISGFLKFINNDYSFSDNINRLIRLNKDIEKEIDSKIEYNEIFLESIYKKAEKYREKQGGKFPAKLILLVEGITEELLLPVFADKMGLNFDKQGIFLIAAGGKNQSARLYKRFTRENNLPILVLLDADAAPVANEINGQLRVNDQIFVIQNGEFEDILPVNLICRALNSFYRLTGEVSPADFTENQPRVALLEKLWKEKGFGEFNKAEFAKIIAENIKDKKDISDPLKQIFLSVLSML